MSPLEVSVPFTTRSELIIEGAALRPGRLRDWGGGAAGAAAAADSFLLENMSTSLNKSARVTDNVVVPDLVMNVRSGAPPRRSEPSDGCAFGYLSAYLYENR